MRYEGGIRYIRQIEQALKKTDNCDLVRNGGGNGDYKEMGNRRPSALHTKVYVIKLDGRTARCRLEFEERNKWGAITIKDCNAWAVAARLPEFCQNMMMLNPVYRHHRRGPWLVAVDKLVGETR